PEMTRECPVLTGKLVQLMLDRARAFTHQALQDDKLLSLGRLSAGLAHELDNPAAAVGRSAKVHGVLLEAADEAARTPGGFSGPPPQMQAARALRGHCISGRSRPERSALEQARHEQAVSDWLDARGLELPHPESLIDASIPLDALDELE